MAPSSLPPLLPTFRTLLRSLKIPSVPQSIESISPGLLHSVVQATVRQDLPVPALPAHSSSERAEDRRRKVETVKLVVGILSVQLGLDFGDVQPSNVVDGRAEEMTVLLRALILLAMQDGWDGMSDWQREPTYKSDISQGSATVRESRRPVKICAKRVVFSAFESPPPAILPLPLAPSSSPGRSKSIQQSAESTSAPDQRTTGQVRDEDGLGEDASLLTLPSLRPNLVTRFTSPEEWHHLRLVEKEALESVIGQLDPQG